MTIINALPFDLLNGTTADATQVMANYNEIVNDVNNNAAHNGVNNDITALNALVTPITPAQGGTNVFVGGTSGGSANAQTVSSTAPTGFALTAGWRVTFIAGFTNTAAATLAVGATAATAILKPSPAGLIPLIGGEMFLGQTVECLFDGTEYVLLTNALENGGFGPQFGIASATTTDLGTAPSHFLSVTGSATITSFGSSASAIYPIYYLQLAGGITLTNSGSMLLPGSANILTQFNDFAIVKYAGSGNWRVLAYLRQSGAALVQPAISPGATLNYIAGLVGSTAGGSGTMAVASGVANDSTNAQQIVLGSAISKTTSSWAVGNGNGGLDTGAIAINTWYHFFIIERTDTGVVDVLFSLSPTSPTLPANYTIFRRIFSGLTDGSSHWTAFTQTGNTFIWATSVADVSTITTVASRVNKTLTVPTGIVVSALFRASMGSSAANAILFTSLQETDQAPSNASGGLGDLASNTTATAGNYERLTNTSAQIGVRSNATTGTYSIFTYGWIDFRGT